MLGRDVSVSEELRCRQMHDVAVFVGAGAPGDGFHDAKEGIVHEPEIPAVDGGYASDYRGRGHEGGEEGNEEGCRGEERWDGYSEKRDCPLGKRGDVP